MRRVRVGGPIRIGRVGFRVLDRLLASPALCRPASCRTRPSAVSERRRHRLTPGRRFQVNTGRLGSPTSGESRRRSASAMCPRWSWVVSIHRLARFRRALSQLSYTTMGPAPGLEPGSTGLQSQRPSRWARPALLDGFVTPRHLGTMEHRRRRRAVAARMNRASSVPRVSPSSCRSPPSLGLP